MNSLEKIYNYHHTKERGWGFVALSQERGEFLKNNIGENKKILDIGCRDGSLTKFYYKNNDVTGVDIDSEALERARKELGINVQHMDLNSISH